MILTLGTTVKIRPQMINLLPCNPHLHVPHPPPPILPRKLPFHTQHLLRQPPPHPYQPAHQAENHTYSRQDAEDVAHDRSATFATIEEGVGIEALGGVGQVGEAKVEGKEEDDEGKVEGGRRGGARKQDFEEGEDGVKGVNGNLGVGLAGGEEGGREEDRVNRDLR